MAAAADDLKIAVIGGSGLYSMKGLTAIREVYPKTPWGYPSDKIVISRTERGQQVAFLARHGQGHVFNPSEIPVRANIAALKSLGVQVIIAYSAVGSLREEIRPRDFVLPDQIIDRTKGIRPSTFFEGGLTSHVVFADPFCKPLANLISAQASALGGQVTLHQGKTLVCMEGPAFSTRAESHLYRAWGGDVINMSALPEAKLAREAEIAYQMVCMATDYDCWKEEEEPVSVETVVNTMATNAANASKLLLAVIESVHCALDNLAGLYTGSMRSACMTSREKRSQEALEKIEFLLPGYAI